MTGLAERIIQAISIGDCAAFRSKWSLAGYVVVGSTALLGSAIAADQDTDVVLLSESCYNVAAESVLALSELCTLLQNNSELSGVVVWFVNATVSVLKLQDDQESVDLLWLSGCVLPRAAAPPDAEQMFAQLFSSGVHDDPKPFLFSCYSTGFHIS